MTTQGSAEESHPWNFQRAEEETRPPGWLDELRQLRAKAAAEGARLMENIRRLSGMKSERGPDPDAPYQPEVDRDLIRLAAREAARAAVEIGTYNEGGNNKKEGSSWQNWILGIAGTVISLGVGALLLQVSDLRVQAASIASKQDTNIEAVNKRLEADERRIENLERRVFR